MFKCKICNKRFGKQVSLMKHVSVSYGKGCKYHYFPWFIYLLTYDGRADLEKSNLEKMYYRDRKSTPIIAQELKLTKKMIIDIMHWYKIKLRNVSEATINQIARDGLWNKGETKYTHPSVKKYADSRRGDNNPFVKAPGYKQRVAKATENFAKYRNRGILKCCPKTTETRMKAILSKSSFQFVSQFYIKYKNSWRWYDFLIEGKLIIEMQGDYYHANPSLYATNDIITIASKKTVARDIWEYDKRKKELAINNGYCFLAIWEKDFIDMSDDSVLNLVSRSI